MTSPNQRPLPLAEVISADSCTVSRVFERMFQQAMDSVGGQIYTEGSPVGIFVGRPAYWMEVFAHESIAATYMESLDVWDSLIDNEGRFTAMGIQTANRIADPDAKSPDLEDYIAHKYEMDDTRALAVTSRAMWDLLMIRGLPVQQEIV